MEVLLKTKIIEIKHTVVCTMYSMMHFSTDIQTWLYKVVLTSHILRPFKVIYSVNGIKLDWKRWLIFVH